MTSIKGMVNSVPMVDKMITAIFGDAPRYSLGENEAYVKLGRKSELIVTIQGSVYKIYAATPEGGREIEPRGQATRLAALFDAIERKDDGSVYRIARSIMDWHMVEYAVKVFRKSELGSSAVFIKEVKVWRRHAYLTSNDVLCYILEYNEEVNIDIIISSLEHMEDMGSDATEDVKHAKVRKTRAYKMLCKSIASQAADMHLRNAGVTVSPLGGSPDNGLLLLSDTTPVYKKQAQKLAKVKLSGGILIDTSSIGFTLVDVPKKKFDGIFALISRDVSKELNMGNCINGIAYQVRAFCKDMYAMKGTMSVPVTKRQYKMLGSYDAIMDVTTYNATYSKNAKVGDVVIIDDMLVLSTDSSCGTQKIHLGHSVLNRAPKNYRERLWSMIYDHVYSMEKAAKSSPESFLPGFGLFKLMKGVTPIVNTEKEKPINYQESAEKELVDRKVSIKKKGINVNGMILYNLPEDGLNFDQCKISRFVAAEQNIKIGDRVTFLIYPALGAYSAEMSNFLFSKKVVGFQDGNTVSLSDEANDKALRDWDGDKLVLTTAFILGEQSKENYSAIDDANNTGGDVLYTFDNAIEEYINLGSSVGRLDNKLESAMKYAEDNGIWIDITFLNRCLQASIEGKKHTIFAIYSEKAMDAYLLEVLPGMFKKNDKGDDVIVMCPDIKWRKGQQYEGQLTSWTADLAVLLDDVKLSKIVTQTAEDYQNKAADLRSKLPQIDALTDVIKKVAAYIRSIPNDNMDLKNGLVSLFGKDVKRQVGPEAFYLISVELMANDSLLKGYYWPFVFTDSATRIDIDREKRNIISTPSEDIRVLLPNEVEKTNEVHIWASRVDSATLADIKIDDIFAFRGDFVTSNNIEFNVDFKKSSRNVKGVKTFKVKGISDVIGTKGQVLETSRRLSIEVLS